MDLTQQLSAEWRDMFFLYLEQLVLPRDPCEAWIWNISSITWDSFCCSIHPLLPGLPEASDACFMKLMDGF